MEKSFNELGEDIYYASQADTDFVNAENEDDSLKTFEELVRLVELQQRLIVEGDVQLRKIDGSLSENEEIKDTHELAQKIQEASVKIEESMQLYMICQQGIKTSQFSLALQSAGNDDPAAEQIEEELLEASLQYLNLSESNLLESQQLEGILSDIRGVQNDLQQIQLDISELKTNPKTSAGSKSERLARLEAQLDKFLGRYNFSRFLTQLLLVASEEDLNDPKISDLFIKCGEALY
ncbi:hypothetical protein DAPPUDRAFT_107012 [Daphnia pulex]|uniref:Uncharacterized protein n=1 Tax=Daphnia pulex TaxID=6669 RepID=E9GVP0_DAPPU|nr:hypothetical protein DAPPUDRAFT_107012 [Daphnia pulex]|eukprot:EFX76495.1 hypothetical protein DAPPUDRAFT_107012 [Daphnia pulex]